MDLVTGFPSYFMTFVHHLDHYHMIQGAVLALFFGIAAGTVAGVIVCAVVATVVYIAADAFIPPLMHHTTIMMPVFDKMMAQEAVSLFVAFLVVIAVIFAIKKAVMSVTR